MLGIDKGDQVFCAIWLFVVMLLGIYAIIDSAKSENCKEQPAMTLPQLPKIDREAAMEFLEAGECLGGEIEEKQFTIFICKGEK